MIKITGYCHITDLLCAVNGKILLQPSPDSEHSWFRQIYNFADIQYPKFHKMDALAQAGVLGVELIRLFAARPMDFQDEGVDLVFANRYASAATDRRFQASYADHMSPSPAIFVYTLPNIITGEIAILKKWYGENTFVVMPEFDPGFFTSYIQRHIARGCEAVIGGWVQIDEENTEVFIFLAEPIPAEPIPAEPIQADDGAVRLGVRELLEIYQQHLS
ncbi:hypothetical protein [Dyadobacter tibetensis]|uniref:hypothetical protein n=1 Tax=Dyadobacter tibetensis TaxID=1211851 RepID=UPI00046ECF83|nr:hypothetical protein [Dyadobacter tibetensis]